MPGFRHFFQSVAKAAAKNAGKAVLGLVPGGEAFFEFAKDVFEDYRRGHSEAELREELERIAKAPQAEVHRIAEQVSADEPLDLRLSLVPYLGQVPAAVRQSLRRPSDSSGTTVPAGLSLKQPEDLLPFLPVGLPRFKPGDRPLPGVDWELEELLGRGGFGEVWKARHPYLKSKSPVALKFCLDASAVVALRNEVGVLNRVMQHGRHPGIVTLLHTYLSADPPCLEYEFIEGGDLASLIREIHATGPGRLRVVNNLLLSLAEIVAFAHRATPPIVHGDLKPANILVRKIAKRGVALKVTDFGIGGIAAVWAVDPKRQTSRSRQELLTEAVRGAYTPPYASPQQMARRLGESPDPRDDVHALGVIWFQLLTGNVAMASVPTDWREQVKERGLAEGVIELLARCFSPKAEKRPDNAGVLVGLMRAELETTGNGDTALAARPKVEDDFGVRTVSKDHWLWDLEAPPKVEGGTALGQLPEERAPAPTVPHKAGVKTHRGSGKTESRRIPSVTTRRPVKVRTETRKPSSGSNASLITGAFLGLGVVTLFLSCCILPALVGGRKPTANSMVMVSQNPTGNAPGSAAGGEPPRSAAPTEKPSPGGMTSGDDLNKRWLAAGSGRPRDGRRGKNSSDDQDKKEAQKSADLAKKAEPDKLSAEEKEKQAQAHKMVEDAKLKLKAKASKERKTGIAALASMGEAAASADYDLCALIAFDPVLAVRRDALDALEKIQPKLHPLVVTLLLPPETKNGKTAGSYLRALEELPAFGRAGLPLISAQLQGKNLYLVQRSTERSVVLKAQVNTLAKIAKEETEALLLLLALPSSPLAMIANQESQKYDGLFSATLLKAIADQLLALGKDKPKTRKAIVPFFIALLNLEIPKLTYMVTRIQDIRVFAAKALAAFGSDAEAALPVLKAMKLDPSEKMRNAVREAIARIEKGEK